MVNREDYEAMELASRLESIRSLIPLGLTAVCEELEREVVSLAGARHGRKPEGAKLAPTTARVTCGTDSSA